MKQVINPRLLPVLLLLALGCSESDSALRSESSDATESAPGAAAPAEAGGAARAGVVARKRIRSATLSIVVRDVPRARASLEQLVVAEQGFLESLETSGQRATAIVTLVARVPETKLDQILGRARKLGQVAEESQESKDVTHQFVDTEARLRNLARTEERLVTLLGQSGSNLADVLAVERELTRVRGEIEQITGELRGLERDVAMAKLAVNLQSDEPEKLAGPDDAWRPLRLLQRDAWATVTSSAAALVSVTAFILQSVLAVLPWIPVLLLVWLAVRRWRRRRAKR